MAFKSDLTSEYVRSLFTYEPETGVFRYRIRKGGSAKIGKIAGSFDKKGYHHLKIDGNSYLSSRIAWLYVTGEWPSDLIDHRDATPINAEFSNLREATYGENARNRRMQRNNTSGFKGVSWHEPRQKWRAHIRVNGKLRHLGYRSTPEEAAALYAEASIELHGEFSRTK